MKIAITGCSGTVGVAIVEQALKDGHRVLGLDLVEPKDLDVQQDTFEFRKVDLTSYDDVLAAFKKCDAVYVARHAHPVVGTNPYDAVKDPRSTCLNKTTPDEATLQSNVTCSYNALRAAAEAGIVRITQLSSINAIGSIYTPYYRQYHYLPLDEKHPYEPADPYALSKMICELQADSLVRTFPKVRIASIRPHACLHKVPKNPDDDPYVKKYGRAPDYYARENINDLWGWVLMESVAKACLLGLTSDGWTGSEAFYIVSPTTKIAEEQGEQASTSLELAQKYHSKASLRKGYFEGAGAKGKGFFDTSKAEKLLGWRHNP